TFADASGDIGLLTLVLTEQGDWANLAKKVAKDDSDEPIELLAHRAAYQRLAGDRAGFEKTVARLRSPIAIGADIPLEARTAAKALFLNDRPADAVAVLIDKKQYLPAFDVLAAQWKYREAFELYDKVTQDDAHAAQALELRRAQFLYQLGEKDQALA